MCLQASMASHQKSLNPNAMPYYSTHSKLPNQQVGFPESYGHPCPQMPSPSVYLSETTTTTTSLQSYHFVYTSTSYTTDHVAVADEQPMRNTRVGFSRRPPRWFHSQQRKRGHFGNFSSRRPNKSTIVKVSRDLNFSAAHSIIPFPKSIEDAEASETTTVMIKNIPYHFKREDVLKMLDEHCIQQNNSLTNSSLLSMYDLVYLPMDYKKYAYDKKESNLGYAFVNFTTPGAACLFFEKFNGQQWKEAEKWKRCEVTKAHSQGKQELVRKYEDKSFRCVNPKFRPVEFRPARDGVNREVKEIWLGRFEKGLPNVSIGRQIRKSGFSTS